jgi:sugar-specific transcriptional regulator TrmB
MDQQYLNCFCHSNISSVVKDVKGTEIQKSLETLGLTEYEAKAYISLVQKGTTTAGNISRLSDIPHSKIYEVLTRLEKRKLVEVQKGKPILYKPVKPSATFELIQKELKVGVENEFAQTRSNLESDYNKKMLDITQAYRVVMDELDPCYQRNEAVEPSEEFVWNIHGKGNLNNQAKEIILSAKNEAYLMVPKDDFSEFESTIRTACSKGVKVRLLIHDLTLSVQRLNGTVEVFQEESPLPTNCGILLADNNKGMFISEDGELGFKTSSRSVLMVLSHFYGHELEESLKIT